MFDFLHAKRAEYVQIIFIVLAAVVMVGLIWSVKESNSEYTDVTDALVANITKCVDKAAADTFTRFGKTGFGNETYFSINKGSSVDSVPIYFAMPTTDSIAGFFSAEITNLTKLCIMHTNYAKFNVTLLTNPAALKIAATNDLKTQKVVLSLTTPLSFMTNDKHSIKIGNLNFQYPLSFDKYIIIASLMWNHLAADNNYDLSRDCKLYPLTGVMKISIAPLDAGHTYLEIIDNKPLDAKSNYPNAYIWHAIVQTSSLNAASCST